VPEGLTCHDKCKRNLEFVHSLIRAAQRRGELDARFDSHELTYGFYGIANFYLASHLVLPETKPRTSTAGRIVDLFLAGAAAPEASKPRARRAR
jgi:hypothetical protein